MGNSPTRHDSSDSSFRENSKQCREYRALENKIRLLKIQASNYNGIGKDAIYTDMFASVQDTVQTVWYLREKSKSSNRKIEYDMLDSELRSCLQILSSKIHQPVELNAGDRQQVPTNKAAEPQQQQHQKTTGVIEQLQYSLDSLESRIMQLRTGFTQFINSHGNQNGLNQLESIGKSMYKDLDDLIAPNNSKKLYLREILQDVLNDIASKQAEFYRTSKYDNLDVSSEPTDPNLQILLKMEKSLDVFRDRDYVTSDNRDVSKMIDTLNCYENDLHKLRITSKDVNKKHVELLAFIGSTIQFLKGNCNGTNNTKHNRDVIDHATKPQDPLMTSIMDELNKIQTTARQNSTNEKNTQLTRILDLLQQVNHSLQLKNNTQLHRSTDNIVSARDVHDGSFDETHQYTHGSADRVRKAAAKTALQFALERKGYRKTFLANTMIKQHAAKMKRTSAETDIPDQDYSLIDEVDKQQGHSGGGHRNSLSMGMHNNDNGNGWFIKPNSPMNSDLEGGGSLHNSLPTNGTSEYRGSPQQSTPNSSRRYDNRSNNKAQQEIEAINRELDYLRNRVGKFNDSRQSSLYEELETLLLELLVRLERVQSEVGAAEATDLLVYSIRDTQKVLYILDEKALKFKTANKYPY